MRLKASGKHFFFYLFIILCLSGCATVKMGATRSHPPTVLPASPIVLSEKSRSVEIVIEPFDVSRTSILGGHYEGILQVRQPWIFGLSNYQKAAIYGDLKNVVRYAFIDEFIRRGLKVIVPQGHLDKLNLPKTKIQNNAEIADLKISGTISSIELNTYGQGLRGAFEGFGSSGNYWESEIVLSDVTVVDRKQTIIWKGNVRQYSKLFNSPVKLDWTIFTLLSKSLQMSSAMGGPANLMGAAKSMRGDYYIEKINENPVEIAARLAAIEIIRRLDNILAEH
ncbi:MAG: hypothetical protein QME06_03340 [Desulfobacterales bacterium]|nr:hypothetical protein [Desulfobacterales bacterium]